MTTSGEITHIRAGMEFRTCPVCGYERGFRKFPSANAEKANPAKSSREVCREILFCPEHAVRFDAGWWISCAGYGSRSGIAPVNTAPCAPPGSPATSLPYNSHDKHDPA
jgi:hypothetical protein